MTTQKEWSEREEKAFQLGRAGERRRIINELRKYSGNKGDEYFAERDFVFICKIVNEEIKGEGE